MAEKVFGSKVTPGGNGRKAAKLAVAAGRSELDAELSGLIAEAH